MRGATSLGVAVVVVGLALVGCGGGGGSTGATETPRVLPGTAKFHVDVATGQVSVTPATSGSRAVMLGGTVDFGSSELLDQPGNTGLKIVNVSVTNRWAQDLGRQPDGVETGVRVLFSPFVAAQAFADLRPRVNVSTLTASSADDSADGPVSSAQFRAPTGVAVAADGSIYVTDFAAHRLRKIRGGFVSTVAGSGKAGAVDGLGAGAQFNGPSGVAVNPLDGTLVVADMLGHRLRRVTPEGRVTTIAGTGVAGGANGTGQVATLSRPLGVAITSNGTIYVAERGGHRVRRIAPNGGNPALPASYSVTTLAGSGVSGLRDGVGTAAQFSFPSGLALSPDGRLYVADSGNNRIRLLALDGAVVTVAGTGAASSTDGNGDAATFKAPFGVCWAGQALVVTEDQGQVIRQLTLKANGTAAPANPSSWTVQTLAGTPANGTVIIRERVDGDGTVATFHQLRLLAVDTQGNLVVADAGHRAIRLVTPPNGLFPVGTVGGTGDASQVRLASADGIIPNSIFGANLPYVSYPGVLAPGASTAAKPWVFAVPAGVTAFEFMVTVSADTGVTAPPEAVTNTFSGPRVVGSPSVRVRTLSGGVVGHLDGDVGTALFSDVTALARDGLGNIYVADRSGFLRCIDSAGQVATIAGAPTTGAVSSTIVNGAGHEAILVDPRGLAVTPDGSTVYVSEGLGGRVRMVRLTGANRANAADWTVSTVAAGGIFSEANMLRARGDAATFAGTAGLVLASPNDLFVAERLGNRVRRLRFTGGDRTQPANWLVTLVAGDPTRFVGTEGDADGSGRNAQFRTPQGLALDAAGTLYVAESGGHRVRRITNAGADSGRPQVSLLAGSPPSTLSATSGLVDGVGTAARFNQPTAVAVDAAGYVYVADLNNRRIRRIAPNAGVATVAGSGGIGAISDGTSNTIVFGENKDGTGATAQFSAPSCLLVDPSGSIYVGDNARLRLIERTLTAGPS